MSDAKRKTGLANSSKLLMALLVTCASASQVSAREGAYLGVGVGVGGIEVKESAFESPDLDTENGIVFSGFSGGYQFANNWSFDIAYEKYDTFDIFELGELIDLDNIKIAAGYRFGEGRIGAFVKGGVLFWDLEVTESRLFNPGAEEVDSRNGSDPFVQIGVEAMIGDHLSTQASFDYSETGFGKVETIKFWVGWRF